MQDSGNPVDITFPEFQIPARGLERRSKAVLQDADRAIFIHDGKSKGTSNELVLAKKMKMEHTYHQIDIAEHESSVGFPIEEEWDVDTDDIDAGMLPVDI